MIARTALRVLAVITGVFGLVVGTASAGYACGLTYVAVDPVDTGCASTAPAVASAVAVLSAFVATAAVVGSAYQGGEPHPPVLTQAIEQMLMRADAEALAGAQNRLAATAASLGLPVDALPFWQAQEFLFQPTARTLDSSRPDFAGQQADQFRQLVLGQSNTSCQVGPPARAEPRSTATPGIPNRVKGSRRGDGRIGELAHPCVYGGRGYLGRGEGAGRVRDARGDGADRGAAPT